MATIKIKRKRVHQIRPQFGFHFDYWLLLAAVGLVIVGLLTVYSTTFDLGTQWKDNSTYYIERQIMALILGLVGFVVVLSFDYHVFRKFSVVVILIALAGLMATLMFGEASNDVQRGLLAGSYQPAEAAKLAMILYISHWLSSKGDRIKMVTYGLIPFSIIVGIVCGLVVRTPDLSTAALIAMVSFTLFFVAGADWRQFLLAIVLGSIAFALLIAFFPYATERWDLYREAFNNPIQAGYQMKQTMAALGRGGITGVGPGNSTQKFNVLPAAHTDGAFAIIAEEFGLFGSLAIMALIGFLVWRGILAAKNARDGYGALLAVGISCWLGYQSLMNIAVITAVIPYTGIPLPFISYGGSAFAVTIVGIAILLNISRDANLTKRPQPKPNRQQQAS